MSHLYSLPDHLARLYDSAEFKDAAKKVSVSLDDFKAAVLAELKKASKEVADQTLRDYEAALGPKALHNGLEKFRDDLKIELRKAVTKIQADQLTAHEQKLGAKALAAATKNG